MTCRDKGTDSMTSKARKWWGKNREQRGKITGPHISDFKSIVFYSVSRKKNENKANTDWSQHEYTFESMISVCPQVSVTCREENSQVLLRYTVIFVGGNHSWNSPSSLHVLTTINIWHFAFICKVLGTNARHITTIQVLNKWMNKSLNLSLRRE